MIGLRLSHPLRTILLAGTAAALCAAAPAARADQAGSAHEAARAALGAEIEGQWGLLETYCMECHNFSEWAGGLALDVLDPDAIGDDSEVWEEVAARMRARMMPPLGSPQPSSEEIQAFAVSLESYLDLAAAENLHLPQMPLHRLNRTQYGRAIQDLLGLRIDPVEMLPRDAESEGFDNIASMLGTSPAFVEQFVLAAQDVSIMAVGEAEPRASVHNYSADRGAQNAHINGLPLGTRGGLLAEHFFPADGEYEFDIAGFPSASYIADLDHPHTVILTIDGRRVFEADLGGEEDQKAADQVYEPALAAINERFQDIRVPVAAGPRQVGVTFIARSQAKAEDTLHDFDSMSIGRAPRISGLRITGPFEPQGVSSTPSRDRIFICYPDAAAEERACAEQILANLASRAFRRQATAEDLVDPLRFYEAGHAEGGFETGVQQGLMAILASPRFLYRALTPADRPSDMQQAAILPISDHDLATRLSFFLWSQPPDAELLELAASGALRDDAAVEAQVQRMLADPRARSLTTNFAFQWLRMRLLDDVDPDAQLFPEFTNDLRTAMRREAELFIDDIFRNDRSVLELLTGEHTYLNERLALHYGVAGVRGDSFRRVRLDDPHRHGLLGKGAILMATSYGDRTSPVLRGTWLLESIIGTPPAAPPPDVEGFPENPPGQIALTVRERLEQHSSIASCAGCHGVIDPLGLALENFDVTGRWRDKDRFAGMEIDASTQMIDGTRLANPSDLRAALTSDPEQFARAFTHKLMIFALGRAVEHHDLPQVRQIVRDAAAEDYRFSALVRGVVNSPQFRMMATPEYADAGTAVREASLRIPDHQGFGHQDLNDR